MHIQNADSPEFIGVARMPFREYEASIKVDLCFQGFEKELASLPGEYARPSGRLLLAFDGDEIAGCGALRRLQDHVCEMKRLYVRSTHRGKTVGASLARALIENAKTAGYATMRLDTMPTMTRAIALSVRLVFAKSSPIALILCPARFSSNWTCEKSTRANAAATTNPRALPNFARKLRNAPKKTP